MHVIYLVRRGRKYHTGCKYYITFFYLREGRHFDRSPLAVHWVTTRLSALKFLSLYVNVLFWVNKRSLFV